MNKSMVADISLQSLLDIFERINKSVISAIKSSHDIELVHTCYEYLKELWITISSRYEKGSNMNQTLSIVRNGLIMFKSLLRVRKSYVNTTIKGFNLQEHRMKVNCVWKGIYTGYGDPGMLQSSHWKTTKELLNKWFRNMIALTREKL